MTASTKPPRSKLRVSDVVATGTHGLRSRKGRTLLTAVGIAIGIASMIAVLGISASSKADLLAQIDRLGTNLLQVQAGSDIFGESAKLPEQAPAMVRRIGPVTQASSVSALDTDVQRNVFSDDNNGLGVLSTETHLFDTLEASLANGRFLDQQTATLPTVVLGSVAAQRLGIDSLAGAPTVRIGGRPFSVIGILDPLPLNPDIDRSVLIGNAAAETHLGADIIPTAIYLRTTPDHVEDVRGVLASTVNPADPNEVTVSRPSDALEARAEVDQNLQNLLLGLGGVALIVGGVGIANVMIISVLERRSEIGLRRALGATRTHIATQFITESTALATLGGIIGTILGTAVTIAYASQQNWLIDIPAEALALGITAALALGALAGLYPASRAARLDPAEAIRPTT
ncbi:MAG: ABC transporter permease [Actinomycetia bacterium]|nr:ABC transporter permease [Actinomycetes bacterium]